MDKAVEISSVSAVGDSFYLPYAKCGKVLIQKKDGIIDGIINEYREADLKKLI